MEDAGMKKSTSLSGWRLVGTMAILALTFTALSVALVDTQGRGQGPDKQSGGGLRVIDGLGQVVGTFVGGDAFAGFNVMSFLDGFWISIEVDTSGFVTTNSKFVWFESVDCTGVPLIRSAEIARESFTFDRRTLQYVGNPIISRSLFSSGLLFPDGSIPSCSQEFGVRKESLGPLMRFDLTTLGLITPFTILDQ